MSKPVVLIAEELSPATLEALGPDFDVINVDGTDRPALLKALANADAILVRSATQVDAEAIAAAPKLKVVARAGVGLDNVDIKAATTAGVMVVNAPTSNVISAAELAIGHIFALARFIPDANASLKAGEWKRSKFTGVELYEKTIAIIGLGRIGSLVAERLRGFGATLIGFDPYVTPARAEQMGVELVSLEDAMKSADFITIHIPKTPETTGMIGEAQFAIAQPELRIVNASRGGIISNANLSRTQGNFQANIDLPIASVKDNVLPFLGKLTLNANIAADTLSDFGTLVTWGAGANWEPTPGWSFIASFTREQGAPSVGQLGDPTIITPNVRVFDFLRGETVDINRLDGGNRALLNDTRQVWKLGFNLKPFEKTDIVLNANYIHSRIDNFQTFTQGG